MGTRATTWIAWWIGKRLLCCFGFGEAVSSFGGGRFFFFTKTPRLAVLGTVMRALQWGAGACLGWWDRGMVPLGGLPGLER